MRRQGVQNSQPDLVPQTALTYHGCFWTWGKGKGEGVPWFYLFFTEATTENGTSADGVGVSIAILGVWGVGVSLWRAWVPALRLELVTHGNKCPSRKQSPARHRGSRSAVSNLWIARLQLFPPRGQREAEGMGSGGWARACLICMPYGNPKMHSR